MNTPTHFTRRHLLGTATTGFGYTALAALAHQAAAAEKPSSLAPKTPHFPAKAKRVIFLFMSGAPSHVDMFDYKPELAKRNGEEVAYGRAQSKLLKSPWEFKQHGQSGQWRLHAEPCAAAPEHCTAALAVGVARVVQRSASRTRQSEQRTRRSYQFL